MSFLRETSVSFLHLGLYLLSGKTSYRKISWSLEAARFGSKLFQSLWNLAGTSAALLPRCLSNFRAIRPLQHPISRLRDFTRFGGKTSYRLVNRGPESHKTRWSPDNIHLYLRYSVIYNWTISIEWNIVSSLMATAVNSVMWRQSTPCNHTGGRRLFEYRLRCLIKDLVISRQQGI